MKFSIEKLKSSVFYHQILTVGKVCGGGQIVEIDEADFRKITLSRKRAELPQAIDENKNVVTLPFEQWPWYIKKIAKAKIPSDKGVGDTSKRLFGVVGGEMFKSAFKALTGTDCNCEARQESWNEIYPYIEKGS